MDLGRRLKEARERAGLSQEALARQADVSTVAVSQIEQGRTKEPHYLTLYRLSKVLGVSPHWLYTGERAEEPALAGKAEAPLPEAGRLEEQRKLFGSWGLALFELNAHWSRWLEDLPEPPSGEELERGKQVIKEQMFPTIGGLWTGLVNYGVHHDMHALVEAESRGIRIPLAFEDEFVQLHHELSVLFNYIIPKARNWYTHPEARAALGQLDDQAKTWKRQWDLVGERSPVMR
jgi:transcriptional regulator with XRE-family HTH domain